MDILGGVFIAIIVIGIICSLESDVSFKQGLKDDFMDSQREVDALWRQRAEENDWYYDSSMIGMGPDTSRHADGTPKRR